MSTKPLRFPLSQDAWKLGVWGQTAPRPPAWLGSLCRWQEPSNSVWAVCVCPCVSAWVSLLLLLELGLFLSLPLARLYATCARCHSKGTANPMGSEQGIPIPARDPGTGCVELWCWSWWGWRYHRALALLSLPCLLGCWGRQRCRQGRSTQSSLQALAAPNLSQEWAADGTCPFVMCPVALPSPRGGPQPGARPPVLAEPVTLDAWEHLPPQGDGWIWDTYSGTVPCHKSSQERDAGPQTLQGPFLQDLR